MERHCCQVQNLAEAAENWAVPSVTNHRMKGWWLSLCLVAQIDWTHGAAYLGERRHSHLRGRGKA